jgi:hypothetical protein
MLENRKAFKLLYTAVYIVFVFLVDVIGFKLFDISDSLLKFSGKRPSLILLLVEMNTVWMGMPWMLMQIRIRQNDTGTIHGTA